MQPRPRVVTYSHKNIEKWKAQLEKNEQKLKKQLTYIQVYHDNLAKRGDYKHAVLDAYSENLQRQSEVVQHWKTQVTNKQKSLEKSNQDLSRYIDEAQTFLTALGETPKIAFDRLRDNVLTSLTEYDNTHPIQDFKVRLCLYGLAEKLTTILTEQESHVEDELKSWRTKYIQLCGFIWDLYDQYVKSNVNLDVDLRERLAQLVQSTHVKWRRSLPSMRVDEDAQEQHQADSLSIGQTCFGQFVLFKNKSPILFHRTESDLDRAEKQDFHTALINLQAQAKVGDKTLCKYAKELAIAASEEISQQESDQFRQPEDRKPEYYVYTRMLRQAKELLAHPFSQEGEDFPDTRLDQFAQSACYVAGQPSHPKLKKFFGAAVGFIGAIIVAVSVMAAVASFGFSTPLSAFGIAVGTTLLWQAGSMIVAGSAALLGIGASMKLFASGAPHGVYEKADKFKQALVNVNQEHEHKNVFGN